MARSPAYSLVSPMLPSTVAALLALTQLEQDVQAVPLGRSQLLLIPIQEDHGHPASGVSCRTVRAGCPATTCSEGTSLATTLLAPTTAPLPMRTPGMIRYD